MLLTLRVSYTMLLFDFLSPPPPWYPFLKSYFQQPIVERTDICVSEMSSYLIQGRRREREVRLPALYRLTGCWCLVYKYIHIKLPELHSNTIASWNYLTRNNWSMPKIDETSSKCSFRCHLPSICILFYFHSCPSSHGIFWQFTWHIVKGVHRRNYIRNKTLITLHQTRDYKMRTDKHLGNVVSFHSLVSTNASYILQIENFSKYIS